uniref:lipase family protein n=1 Tax=Gordonia sp. B7-2 TaxID=3420932 RepID=UPI003D8BA7FA
MSGGLVLGRFSRIAVIAVLVAGVSMLIATTRSAHVDAAPSRAGDLVGVTDITAAPDARVAGAGKVYRVTYLSPDHTGKLIGVRGTVMIPAVKRLGGWRVLGYAHGTAGLGDKCTVTDRMGGRYDNWLGPWLRDGYVIAASEYAGIGSPGPHTYLDGQTAARNVIDSVRAARNLVSQKTSGTTSRGYVTGGGSQGGHTAIWATRIASSYAPELVNVGGLVNAPPVDIADYFSLLRPGVPPVAIPDYATYFSYVMAGLDAARPDARVSSYLTPLGRKVVDDAKTLCYPNQGRATRGITVGQLISRPLADGPLIPALREYTRVPTAGFGSPMLVQQGYFDPVAFEPLTRNWVEQARRNGARIDFRQYSAGHGLGPWAEATGLAWADRQGWPTR